MIHVLKYNDLTNYIECIHHSFETKVNNPISEYSVNNKQKGLCSDFGWVLIVGSILTYLTLIGFLRFFFLSDTFIKY